MAASARWLHSGVCCGNFQCVPCGFTGIDKGDIVTKNLKTFYLVSAILGAVVLYYCFWHFLGSEGIGVMPLIEGALINGAAAGFTLDVVISSLVFWAFMLSQKEKGPAPLRFILLNLFVVVCLAGLWAAQSRSALTVRSARMSLPVRYHAGMLRGGLLKAEGFPVPDSISQRIGQDFTSRSRDFLQREFLKIYRECFAVPLPQNPVNDIS